MSQPLRVVRNGLQVYQSSGADPVYPPDLIPDYCSDEAIHDLNAQRAISDQEAEGKIREQIMSDSSMFPDKYFEEVQV